MAGLPYRSHRLATARSSPSISTPSLSPLVSFILARPRLSPLSTRKPLVDRPRVPAPRVAFVPQHSRLVASPISRPIPLKLSRRFALVDHFGHTVPLSMAEAWFGCTPVVVSLGADPYHSPHLLVSIRPHCLVSLALRTLLISISSAFRCFPYATCLLHYIQAPLLPTLALT
ncbi:hypothetical protein EDB83DRAFT_2519265 [Lactarius deliciosus]|nr:hypothetical protein EDB83DRAFT_2519265 [Lactarius deliciosus]